MFTRTFYLLLVAMCCSVSADDWPQWRGATQNDVVAEASQFDTGAWPPGTPSWTTNVGIGSTSPIVIASRLYTMGWDKNRDHVYCLDTFTGKELWSQSYPCKKYGRRANGDQSLYSGVTSTPAFDAETKSLFTLSTDGDVNCWNTAKNGKRVWGFNLNDRFTIPQRPRVGRSGLRDYGYTTSPLVYKNWLIIEVGAKQGNLVAFDKRTGKQIWLSQATDEPGHTGGLVPMAVDRVPCLVVMTFQGLLVARLDRGNEGKTVATWPWITDYANNISGPAVHGQDVLISSGYNQEKMLRLHISLDGEKGSAGKIWERDLYSKVCTPIIHDGNIYWAWRKLHCLDWATGKSKWAGGRFGDAGSCIMTSDDRLIVWGGLGSLVLVDPTATRYRVLAEKRIRSRNEVWPHVVLSEKRLYCKDARGAVSCFDLQRKAAPPISKPTVNVAEQSIDLKQWPGNHDSVVLAWRSGFGKRRMLGRVTKSKQRLRLTERDEADFSPGGAMDMSKGAFIVHGVDTTLLKECVQSNQVSIETVLTSNKANQRGPARIISFSSDPYKRNFTLGQEGQHLILRLRTPRTGDNGSKPEVSLCPIEINKPVHVIVSYRPGQLVCYLDGRRVLNTNRVTGDLSNWTPQHLLFGDEWTGDRQWSGAIERIALHSRFIGPDEASRRAAMAK